MKFDKHTLELRGPRKQPMTLPTEISMSKRLLDWSFRRVRTERSQTM